MAKKPELERTQDISGGAVVPTGPLGGALQLQRRDYWTSLDLSTPEGKRLFMACKNGETIPAEAMMGKEFKIQDVLIHEVEEVDKDTNEVLVWVRYCLIQPDGKIISGGSSGIRNSLADMIVPYGTPPWKGGVAVKLVQRVTRNKFKVHLLETV